MTSQFVRKRSSDDACSGPFVWPPDQRLQAPTPPLSTLGGQQLSNLFLRAQVALVQWSRHQPAVIYPPPGRIFVLYRFFRENLLEDFQKFNIIRWTHSTQLFITWTKPPWGLSWCFLSALLGYPSRPGLRHSIPRTRCMVPGIVSSIPTPCTLHKLTVMLIHATMYTKIACLSHVTMQVPYSES